MGNDITNLSPVHSRRRKRPLFKRLVHSIASPFTEILGGPEIGDCRHQRVDCGPLEVEFYLPRAVLGGGSAFPRQVDTSQEASFVEGGLNDDRTGHRVCELGISNWSYRSPRIALRRFLPVPREPYVIVTAYWQLERIKNGIQLEVDNTAMLEQYLRDDFIAYLESEGGENWKTRKRITDEHGPQGRNSPQEIIDTFIASWRWASPSSYTPLSINGKPWLRYNWAPKHDYPKSLLYTCVLTPDTLFTVRFHLVEMIGGSLKHWWNPLVEDSEVLMDGMKVHYRELT